MTEIFSYTKKLSSDVDLNDLSALNNPAILDSVNSSADFSKFHDYLKECKSKKIKPADSDLKFSKIIYKILYSELSIAKSLEGDIRFWQWLAVVPLRDYVFWRWGIEHESDGEYTDQHYKRFLGQGGAGGYSWQSISRLYFPAKLILEENSEDLLKSFWSLQQKEQSIAQNEQAFNPNVFIALVKAVENVTDGDAVTEMIRKISGLNGAICFDYLQEDEILSIIK